MIRYGSAVRVADVDRFGGRADLAGALGVVVRTSRRADDLDTFQVLLLDDVWSRMAEGVNGTLRRAGRDANFGGLTPALMEEAFGVDGRAVLWFAPDELAEEDEELRCPTCGSGCYGVRALPGGAALFMHDGSGHAVQVEARR